MGKVAVILAKDSTVLVEIHRVYWLNTGELWAFLAFIFLDSWAFQTVTHWYYLIKNNVKRMSFHYLQQLG